MLGGRSIVEGGCGILWLAFLPHKVANKFIVGQHISVALRLSMMQDQKLWMRHWLPFSGGGNNNVSSIFAHNGGWYIDDGLIPTHSVLSVHDAEPKMVDTPLTLILKSW